MCFTLTLPFKMACVSGLGVRRIAVRGGRCGLTCGRRAHALSQQHPILDIPGSTVDENLPASVGDMGSIPGPGRSQHTKEQLSLCTPTTKPVLCNERNHHNGKFMHPN